MVDKLYVRDCFQQAKTIHRLMLVLCDDLGDLSADRDADKAFGEFSDLVCELESKMQAMRGKLEELSRGSK